MIGYIDVRLGELVCGWLSRCVLFLWVFVYSICVHVDKIFPNVILLWQSISEVYVAYSSQNYLSNDIISIIFRPHIVRAIDILRLDAAFPLRTVGSRPGSSSDSYETVSDSRSGAELRAPAPVDDDK